MPSLYNLTQTDQGYSFVTDHNIEYTIFFTMYYLDDTDGNEHTIYSFGFERSGSFKAKKYEFSHDVKIKTTIIHVVKEFFIKNEDNALLYFCWPDDDFARHRSIIFSKWCKESDDIEHKRGTVPYGTTNLYGGILVKKENPLKSLLVNAFEKHINDQFG